MLLDLPPPRIQVGLLRPDKPRPKQHLVPNVKHHEQDQTDVCHQKIARVPRHETRKPSRLTKMTE